MGIFVVALLVAVGVLSLSGGEAGPLGGIVGSDTPATPEFAFDPAKPKAVETSADPNHKAAAKAAEPAAAAKPAALNGGTIPAPEQRTPGQ